MNEQTFFYSAFNLVLSAPFQLPYLHEVPPCKPDVAISLKKIASLTDSHSAKINFFEGKKRALLIHQKQVGFLYTKNGNQIFFNPYPNCDWDYFWILLYGPVISSILQQRGFLLLHGNAIVYHDQAILCLGKTNLGKSHLAADFQAKGHPIITDDIAAITFIDEKPYIVPSYPFIKLRQNSLRFFNFSKTQMKKLHREVEKYYISLNSKLLNQKFLVKQLYILDNKSTQLDLQNLRGQEKWASLYENISRPELIYPMQLQKQHFLQCAKLANSTSITKVLVSKQKRCHLSELIIKKQKSKERSVHVKN
jgi:hypothetical protein